MADYSISRKLFDQTFGFIGRSLDVRTLNNKVLSSNIANSERFPFRKSWKKAWMVPPPP
jgi:hypothetical protein